MQTYWLAFLTGLTTGGISCFAVQGSLLISSMALENKANATNRIKVKSLAFFLISKLIAHTLLGLGLGLIGEKLIVAPKVQGLFQIFIGVYMLIIAANFLNLHPFFRKLIITPPKFVLKILRKRSKENAFITPIFLGALSVFIPCGVTQGMMLLSLSASNPVVSALILFFFILGTFPVFLTIGLTVNQFFKNKVLTIIAAIVVALMGLLSINSGQILRGSIYTFQNYWRAAFEDSTESGQLAPIVDGFQIVDMTVKPNGYVTPIKKLRAGVPVRLTLTTNSIAGCSRAFTIPEYNISKVLPATGTQIIEFTPDKIGDLTYTCSMGMYSGYFDIIK